RIVSKKMFYSLFATHYSLIFAVSLFAIRCSASLDRQRRVLGPFAHRTVVEREVLKTELVEQKQIDGRRYAAAAIADHGFVAGEALRGEFGFGVRQRDEILVAVDDRRRRHVDAARDASGAAIAARFQAFVELWPERVDDRGVPLLHRRQHGA